MTGHEAADAAFYQVVHHLLTETAGGETERRDGHRHEYPGRLLLAPYTPAEALGPAQFRQIRCWDLSPRGFSFLLPERPGHEAWVIALGQPPTSFFLARTQHVTQVYAGGATHYRIGCRFIQRLGR